jgi:glycine betaine/proline transport system permease protein
MDPTQFDLFLDGFIEGSVDWLNVRFSDFFHGLSAVIDGALAALEQILLYPPYYVAIVIAALVSWRAAGWRMGAFTALSLLLCQEMDLWEDTIKTLSLILLATFIAVAIAIPIGILAASSRIVDRITRPLMDFIQTMPPYVYLIPAVAILGFDRAPAVVATVIVAIAPALRLTNLAIRQVPVELIELGRSVGATSRQILWKIKLPSALPMIMAGVNQSLMLGLGMVVIAGIIGAGGLGEVVYRAIRYLEVDKAVDAGLAIVILAINLDRISQNAIKGMRSGSDR